MKEPVTRPALLSRSPTPGSVLLACVLSNSLGPLRAVDVADLGGVDTFLEATRFHRLDAFLADLATSEPAPAALRAALGGLRTQRLMRQAALGADLQALSTLLEAAGIPWTVLKGPVTAGRHYVRPEQRSYSDLDVLVAPRHFEDAIDRIVAAGARLVDQNWRLVERLSCGELNLVLPMGTFLDLHWDLFSQRHDRRAFRADTAGVLARARPLLVPGAGLVAAVEPVDELIHLCLHAVAGGTNSLGRLRDVTLASSAGVDYEALIHRAGQWRAGLAVAVALERSWSLFGSPSDAALLRRLTRASGWRRSMRLAGQLFPDTTAPPSTRRSRHLKLTRSSAAASAGYALTELLGLAVHPVYQRRRDGWDATELQQPDGDTVARGAYFDAVKGS